MKKIILSFVFAMLVLVGCSNNSTSGDKIGFSISTQTNPFFVTMKTSAEKAAKDAGYTLVMTDAKDNAATQTSDIESLISQGVKVLIVNPVDSKAVASSIKAAQEKGIKVISVDRSVDGATVDSHIASDNVAGGKLAGDYMAEQLKNSGKVLILEGIAGASATVERGQGFEAAIAGKLTVAAKQTANFEKAQGLTVMENLMQSNKDFKGVFAHNDEMILGALQALTDTSIVTVGFDGNADALQAIKDGKLDATVIQQPDKMGSLAIENAGKLIKGEKVEASIPVDLILVTSANVADFLK